MSQQNQQSGSNSVNNQVGKNQYTAYGGSINVKEQNDEKRLEFIRDVFLGVVALIGMIVAFITNPVAEDHTKQIARGAFSSYQLDKEFFYENNLIYSRVYVLGDRNQEITFSWGAFNKVIETSDYRHNQRRLTN